MKRVWAYLSILALVYHALLNINILLASLATWSIRLHTVFLKDSLAAEKGMVAYRPILNILGDVHLGMYHVPFVSDFNKVLDRAIVHNSK